MERQVIHHRGAGDDSIALLTGGRLMQKFDISEMSGEQRSEAMSLSIGWLNQPRPTTRVKTVELRKARIVDDIRMSERVANYAEQMTEVQRTRRQNAAEAKAKAKEQSND